MTPTALRKRLRGLSARLANPKSLLKAISSPTDDLTFLANRYGSDKGDQILASHHYTRVYSQLFAGIRHKPLRLLEIGLLNVAETAWDKNPHLNRGTASGSRAPSLQMWSAYFPRATIFGFDVNDFSRVSVERCRIIRGDMGSRDDLHRLVVESGGSFDIVVDDASHASHHQQIALAVLFPHLNSGGLYVIEDLYWQPMDLEIAGPKTRDVLRNAEITGSIDTPHISADDRKYLSEQISSIALFDSLTGDAASHRDALAVLTKR